MFSMLLIMASGKEFTRKSITSKESSSNLVTDSLSRICSINLTIVGKAFSYLNDVNYSDKLIWDRF